MSSQVNTEQTKEQANEQRTDALKQDAGVDAKSPSPAVDGEEPVGDAQEASTEADNGRDGEGGGDGEKVSAAQAIDFLTRLRISELEKKVADYESKIGGIRDYVKNLEAEMESARLRALRDQEKVVDQKLASVFRDILAVADNLDRSVKAAEGEKSALADGIRMVHQQLHESLSRLGLERILTKGEAFNPEIHEALTMMSVTDAALDQKVVEEVQTGFRYKGSLVRAAQVIVGKVAS